MVAMIVLACVECDVFQDGMADKLAPLFHVLDHAWLLPCVATGLALHLKLLGLHERVAQGPSN